MYFDRYLFYFVLGFLACPANAAVCLSPFDWPQATMMSAPDADLFQVYASEKTELRQKPAAPAKNQAALTEFYRQHNQPEGFIAQLQRPQKKLAEELLVSVFNHPVVGERVAAKYDPLNEIGFCFGRAAYVHLELLRRGVSPQHLAKVFAMGALFRDGTGWDYHMATMLQDFLGQWWVIDPLVKNVMPLELWMREVAKWDGDRTPPKLRFYFTDAAKFQPTRGSYDRERLAAKPYRGYFNDLAASFKKITCQK